MGRRLTGNVVVRDPATQEVVTLLAGSELPEWAEDQVGDHVLEAPFEEPALEEPPRSGKGSGEEAWLKYAESRGIDVPEGSSRDDVIALVDASK